MMLTTLLLLLLLFLFIALLYLRFKHFQKAKTYYSRKPAKLNHGYKNAPKPPWVVKEVIKLKALSNEGCRSVSHMFNRRFSDTRNIPLNKIWVMDLTFITNQSNTQTPILGIIDHQRRLSLSLTQLQTKSTINILRVLFDAIEKFGKPENISFDIQRLLTEYRCWYNHLRPHDYLGKKLGNIASRFYES